MSTTKTARINLRATPDQEDKLRRAAESSNTSVSEFVLGTAVDEAERILADRRWFTATEEQFDEFVALLDTPVNPEKLKALLARTEVFDKPLEIDD